MFRSSKWRSEKNRIKAVFKLQFNATKVLQSGVDALVLSIVPGDIGRPTKRLEKATVQDGNCRWENPVYETDKYYQDPKTGKINDKIYPKTSIIRIREEDECEDRKLKFDDKSSRNQFSNGDTDESTKSYFSEGLIKSKETALETSTTSSMKKEKELQSRIMELENKVDEFNRNVTLHEDRSIKSSNEISEEVRNRSEHADNSLSGVMTELSSLKERNKSMESELKEMQERYSEMSLKFAEVEGERQILVMTVRNLKSVHKG